MAWPGSVTPLLWLKASAVSGNDGDTIAFGGILDQSGSGNNASSAANVTLKKGANGINGVNVLRFGATSTVGFPSFYPTDETQIEVWAVVKMRTAAAQYFFGSSDATWTIFLNSGSALPAYYLAASRRVESSAALVAGTAVLLRFSLTVVKDAVSPVGSDATNYHLWINGIAKGLSEYGVVGGLNTAASFNIASFNGGIAAGTDFDLAEVAVIGDVSDGNDTNAIHAYFASVYGFTLPTITAQRLAVGHSICAGANGADHQYFAQVIAAAPSSMLCLRWAAGGQRLTNGIVKLARYVGAVAAGMPNDCLLDLFTNDLTNTARSTAAIMADAETFRDAMAAVGCATIPVTVDSREDVNFSGETNRIACNDGLRARTWGGLADVETVPQLGADNAANNATYFDPDKIHPIAAGHDLRATLILATYAGGIHYPSSGTAGGAFQSSAWGGQAWEGQSWRSKAWG